MTDKTTTTITRARDNKELPCHFLTFLYFHAHTYRDQNIKELVMISFIGILKFKKSNMNMTLLRPVLFNVLGECGTSQRHIF